MEIKAKEDMEGSHLQRKNLQSAVKRTVREGHYVGGHRIAKEGIKIWDWTIDSKDWKLKDDPEQIVENIKKATKVDLEVVLMHEKPQTLQVLSDIITFYQKKRVQVWRI